ncbi:MAG: DUF4174 domain-containing protein [Rhodobacter sp.]|nr:DUF4174 domain-containing protein [Rhodobacter sp.]MCY4169771.1 DUF4174 domain-containing protein [Rhodobacter sp.]MCY4243550.1 DUF4174 domain-containing protein [Rhodobacter sp.]
MRQIHAIAITTLLAVPAWQDSGASATESTALVPVEAADVSLDEFLWLKRPIVVFADTPADPNVQEQLELLLERPDELLERDVVLIVDTDPGAETAIRTRLRPRGFMLTLIGKDGKINLRKPFPWNVREITHAMDRWPLRQKEIRDAKATAAGNSQ